MFKRAILAGRSIPQSRSLKQALAGKYQNFPAIGLAQNLCHSSPQTVPGLIKWRISRVASGYIWTGRPGRGVSCGAEGVTTAPEATRELSLTEVNWRPTSVKKFQGLEKMNTGTRENWCTYLSVVKCMEWQCCTWMHTALGKMKR